MTSPYPGTPRWLPGRPRRGRAGVTLALVAVLSLTSCGQQTPRSTGGGNEGQPSTGRDAGTADQPVDGGVDDAASRVVRLAAGSAAPRLVCPTGERSLMVADIVAGAKGAPTPEKAVGLAGLKEGEQLVVSARGAEAWVVRADGTARERIGLLDQRGWLVSERESCA